MAEKVAAIKEELELDPGLKVPAAVRDANEALGIEGSGTLAEQVEELISQLGLNLTPTPAPLTTKPTPAPDTAQSDEKRDVRQVFPVCSIPVPCNYLRKRLYSAATSGTVCAVSCGVSGTVGMAKVASGHGVEKR